MGNLRVGQKVVCIDAEQDAGPEILVKNQVYTIVFLGVKKCLSYREGYGNHLVLKLAEVENPYSKNGEWLQSRFKPVHTIESDSEMFRRISEDIDGRLDVLEDALNEPYLCDETHQ